MSMGMEPCTTDRPAMEWEAYQPAEEAAAAYQPADYDAKDDPAAGP